MAAMKIVLLVIATIGILLNVVGQGINTGLSSDQFEWNVSRKGMMRYLLYLPKDYASQKDTRWPMMLFLHGAGERGSDVQAVARHGPLKLVREGREFPFIIVAPQCPAGQYWNNDTLLEFLDTAQKKYRVDENRIYVAGLSMGGYGTWKLGLSHPEKFAAIMPICGGGEKIDIVMGSIDHADALNNLPIWAFHGAKDPVVPVSESEETIALLKSRGAKEVKLTIYPDAMHDSWTRTFENQEVYDWLLEHARKNASSAKK
jgi:predicted peptidase